MACGLALLGSNHVRMLSTLVYMRMSWVPPVIRWYHNFAGTLVACRGSGSYEEAIATCLIKLIQFFLLWLCPRIFQFDTLVSLKKLPPDMVCAVLFTILMWMSHFSALISRVFLVIDFAWSLADSALDVYSVSRWQMIDHKSERPLGYIKASAWHSVCQLALIWTLTFTEISAWLRLYVGWRFIDSFM